MVRLMIAVTNKDAPRVRIDAVPAAHSHNKEEFIFAIGG